MRALSLVCAGLACLPLAAQEAKLPVIRSTTQEEARLCYPDP